MNNSVKISVCVPVYNNEQYLSCFLDSVLQQNFEDYEIILADNHSTDRSMEVLQRYRIMFPDKIFVYQTSDHRGPGAGRNLAFQKSTGKYIYWCDADDFLHPDALNRLYAEAEEYDADIVCASGKVVVIENDGVQRILPHAMKKNIHASNEAAIMSGVEFWLRLFKRSFIERFGEIPEDTVFDDVNYIPVLHSYAKHIRYISDPVYYWVDRISSTSRKLRKETCIDSLEAEKNILQKCNPAYIDAVQHYVTGRIYGNFDLRWPFFDLFVDETRKFSAWIYENDQIINDRKVFNRMKWADALADIQFNNNIYVDYFVDKPSAERIEELRNRVFHDGCEIVALSEETCDINENVYVKRAYDQGDFAFVAGYFALKKIYEYGGVFIHNNIRILNYFSYLKYQNSFFALLDKSTYSDWIFGASAGNEAIGAILKTYSDAWDKKGEYIPLSQRISIVLCGKYGIPLDGKARLFGKIVSVLPPDMAVTDTQFGNRKKMCAFEHDFSQFAGEEGYVTIPRTSLQIMMSLATSPNRGKSAREVALEREMAEMRGTNTYKIMMKIREIGEGPGGPFLRKIFHKLLKIRAKLKHK